MTARQVWEYMLIETAKQRVQPMLLEDFNYILNKTILMYIDKVYHAYGVNQKIDDNLRVLMSTSMMTAHKSTYYNDNDNKNMFFNGLPGAYYEVNLPLDYVHILNVTGVFEVKKQKDCYDVGDFITRPCVRMTSDISTAVMEDFYNRPSIRKPYYFIKNVNPNNSLPTNPYENGAPLKWTDDMTIKGTDVAVTDEANHTGLENGDMEYESLNPIPSLPRSIEINKKSVSLVEKLGVNRYGNASPIRMEIRYGKDDTIFELKKVSIDYLKSPQYVRLTQKQIDMQEDTSQILEYPDVTCQEIINDLVPIYMGITGDARLQTTMQVNQAVQNSVPIGVPAQQPAAQ